MCALRFISPFRQANVNGISVYFSTRNASQSSSVGLFKNRYLTAADNIKDLEYNKSLTTTSFLCLRNMSTEVSPSIKKQSMFSKVRNLLFDPPLLLPASTLLQNGHFMYFCITESIDFKYYIKEFDMPDTLNSYFILVTLHLWLCTTRLSTIGSEGEILRNSMVEIMWKDIEEKGKALVSSMEVKEALKKYDNTLLYILLSLDEGLLSDDKTLAGSIWRVIYDESDVEPEKLELLVYYIRKQVHHLQQIDSFKLLSTGMVQFLDIHGDKVNDKFLKEKKQKQELE